jgi:dienelactone hydrolase
MSFALPTGAEARWTGAPGRRAVVCVNGGTAAEIPGTWSASVEWLVRRLSHRFPALGFLEVRYRIKSWRRLELCVEDAAAAIGTARESGAEELALLGFSMGGAVAVRNAAAAGVELVAGVNPWLPPQLELGTLQGRRLAIAHGALDAPLPLIPGVKPSMSQAAAERARASGIEVERQVVPFGFHAVALRRRDGGMLALPGAERYAEFVGDQLERFCA